MWLMLQQDKAEDYVLASGETHPVREFVTLAFKEVGIDVEWKGEGINEQGYDKATGKTLVEVDSAYFRPTEVDLLHGDASKAKKELGWEPVYTFQELVTEMVKSDMELFQKDKYLKEGGHKTFNYHE